MHVQKAISDAQIVVTLLGVSLIMVAFHMYPLVGFLTLCSLIMCFLKLFFFDNVFPQIVFCLIMCFLSGCFGPIFNETTALVHLFCCHWSWRQVPHWRNPLLVDSILDFIKVACSLKPSSYQHCQNYKPLCCHHQSALQHLCWRKSKVSNQSTKSAASFTNYTSAPKQRLQLAEIQVCTIVL